ncbi:Uma2 family endonuclease [Streptomyces sp. I05A-00742]|uniref:Uma2 family endonuclease n=1 Tax=Streptomyces sp. I05A-00742 TaxID=2732853 RepID=UPI001488479C|nr:Uma2 family endonuclease [Streptomyces sp. I05A-00742]
MDYARMRAIAEELLEHAPDPIVGVEITGDGIFMMMSPSRPHELIAMRLRRQLDSQLAEGLVAHPGGEVEDAAIGKLRRPDLIVVPEEIFAEDTMDPFHPRDLSLVVEIVSPTNHGNDYVDKMRDYPLMGIPLYLLIDPRKGTLSVMSDPHGTDDEGRRSYRQRADYIFGDKVPVGPWTVDSSEFRRYPD